MCLQVRFYLALKILRGIIVYGTVDRRQKIILTTTWPPLPTLYADIEFVNLDPVCRTGIIKIVLQ